MSYLFRIIVLAIMCICYAQPYCGFLNKFESQYAKDSAIRQVDSLFYIPTVMNLVGDRKYRSSSVVDCKSNFFKRLSKKKTSICYTKALGVNTGCLYSNPRGDLDYWENKKEPIQMFKQDTNNLHPLIQKKLQVLTDYIKVVKPSFVFSIADATYEPHFDVYWAIRGSSLYALRISRNDASLEEYEAEFYINYIAPDEFFSSALRLEMLNNQP